jgi:hypothetical protein
MAGGPSGEDGGGGRDAKGLGTRDVNLNIVVFRTRMARVKMLRRSEWIRGVKRDERRTNVPHHSRAEANSMNTN